MLKIFSKKATKLFLCFFIASASLVSIPVASGRKLTTKTVSDTMNGSIYTFNYSFSSSAVLTYSNETKFQIYHFIMFNVYAQLVINMHLIKLFQDKKVKSI